MSEHNSEEQQNVDYRLAAYLLGASELDQLPADEGVEIAFAGRSNAGKSSALNKLTEQKSLARTSKTPGRTQLINVFTLDEQRRLIDLPGYGFAKVSKQVKKQWDQVLSEYLQTRRSLRALVILIDIRHPNKEMDWAMINWALQANLDLLVLLSKSDKVKQGVRSKTVREVKQSVKQLNTMGAHFEVTSFSVLKNDGIRILEKFLNTYYNVPNE